MARKSIQRSTTQDDDTESQRIYSLRSSFCLSQVESHVEYFRHTIAADMPGEPNYKRPEHIKALRKAIEYTKNKKTWDALRPHRHLGAEHDAPLEDAELAECEARFDATMRLLCLRDPFISEAYLGSARMRDKIRLVHSRD